MKQSIEVRWDSTVVMLQSIQDNFRNIRNLALNDSKVMKKFSYIVSNESLLNDWIDFLSKFYSLRCDLCKDTHVTFQFVLPTKQKMLKICIEKESDSHVIKVLKQTY